MSNLIGRGTLRRRRRGALLGGALALALAFGALNAAGAAALGEQCSGSGANGLGAFLQAHAQQDWASGKLGFNASGNPLACNGSQGSGGTPAVAYTPVESAGALRAWGADDGALHVEQFAFPVHSLGTDIPPSGPVGEEGTMLAKMKAARGSDVVVVPVTQTAIAIAANPPALPAHASCAVPRISIAQLQGVFSGQLKNWRRLSAASDTSPGGDCDQAITRIVRDESAGTTYQFKHYLFAVNSSALPCTGKAKRTWAQLQAPFGGEAPANVEWPSNSQCQAGEGNVTTVAGPGGEGEVASLSYVASNPGTLTYGSLPEAELWAPKRISQVYNGVKPAAPATESGEANCAAAKYTLPSGAESGVDVDWSQVYGSDPKIGKISKSAYPICTLTWSVAATDSVGLFGKGVATTLRDYLSFAIASEGGQAAVRHDGYQDLPSPVAKAAAAAIAQIDGEEKEEEKEEKEEEEKEGGTGTVLCKAAPTLEEGVLTCPSGKGFSGEVTGTVVPETVATFESISGPKATIACPEGYYVGEFNEDGTSAGNGVTVFQFGQKEGCTTTFPEENEAVVSFQAPPFDASQFTYTNPLEPQGVFTLAKAKGFPLLRVQSAPECIYAPNAQGDIANGLPTQMSMKSVLKLWEGNSKVCPAGLAMSALLTVTRAVDGGALFMAGK